VIAGSSAFSGCTGLTNITLPASVTSIGGGAFNKRLALCAGEESGLFKVFRLNIRVKNIFDSLNIIEANRPKVAKP
jgi:hypothetical protein